MRRVTRIVQLAPFAYLALYSTYMLASVFAPDGAVSVADGVLYNSPLVTLLLPVLSRALKLCRWHRAACLIPSVSQVEGVVDCYLFTFTQTEIIIINATVGLLSAAFLVIANRHFYHDNGRKEHTVRDARLLQA